MIDFERLFRSLPAPYMILDGDLRFIDMNDLYLEVTERTREDLLGRYVFDAFPESGERLAMFREAFERAARGEANSLIRKPFSIPRPAADGGGMKEVWWTCHHVPVLDENGIPCGLLQSAEDVTAEVTAGRMRDVISQEFDHRVKNLLSKISALARITAKSSASTEAFVGAFDSRIAAMARTHQMLVAGGWGRMLLSDLLESELQPFRETNQLAVIDGPSVALSSKQAQALGMAFHELVTNAVKYGAFSHPDGRLVVRWSLDPGADRFTLVWKEDGLTGVTEPRSEGFGTTIVERVLPMEMSGTVERQFRPNGMRCTMTLSLDTGSEEAA